MPRTLNAYLDPAQLPDRAALQAAIKSLGFKLGLDGDFAPPDEVPGYLPCTLEGEDAGVYLRYEAPSTAPGEAAAQQAGRNALLQLRWGGDAREHLAALVMAAALARQFNALLVDSDDGTQPQPDDLIKHAKRLHAENF